MNPKGNPQNLKPFKPGQSGNPGGRKKRVADDAVEAVFEELQGDEQTSLVALARANPMWFYEKIVTKRLTSSSENRSHVVTETVSEEQARRMAEEYLARASSTSPDPVHGGDEAGLQAGQPASADS